MLPVSFFFFKSRSNSILRVHLLGSLNIYRVLKYKLFVFSGDGRCPRFYCFCDNFYDKIMLSVVYPLLEMTK